VPVKESSIRKMLVQMMLAIAIALRYPFMDLAGYLKKNPK